MDKASKMFSKKKKDGKELDPVERDAKMGVIKDMRDMASGEMADRLKGLKKVSVASDSKAGLSEGLDKAKELIGKMSESNEAPAHEGHDELGDAADENEEEQAEAQEEEAEGEHADHSPADLEAHGDMSEEDIDNKIKELMRLKMAKKQS